MDKLDRIAINTRLNILAFKLEMKVEGGDDTQVGNLNLITASSFALGFLEMQLKYKQDAIDNLKKTLASVDEKLELAQSELARYKKMERFER